MIAAAAVLSAALLAGWLAGLTRHALTFTRWRDRGARAAWTAAAAMIATPALLIALALCLSSLPRLWLLALCAAVVIGERGGWRASHAIRLALPPSANPPAATRPPAPSEQ
jgi:hypothetical protein